MKNNHKISACNVMSNQSGQVLIWVAVGLIGMLGISGLALDVGHAYIVRGQLQSSANAAALSAAASVYNSGSDSAENVATTYAAKNAIPGVSVTTTVSTLCLNALMPNYTGCSASGAVANAIRVKETATIPTYLMRVLGLNSLTVSALATASMQGKAQPWNVVIIVDATGSMGTYDSYCSGTRFQCAMKGIQTMLAGINPCIGSDSSTCNFRVSLYSYPDFSTDTASNNYSSCSQPNYMVYSLPSTTSTTATPPTYSYKTGSGKNAKTTNWTATYQALYGASDADANGFVSNYYSASASNKLDPNSSLVKAITNGCMKYITSAGSGVADLKSASSGGGITYFAGAIYAAQAALLAEQTVYPKAKNAIILLSDGQANVLSSTKDFPSQTGTNSWTGFTSYPSTSTTGLYNLTSTGYYPSNKNECQQAILAAQAATAAGTRVYSVAYGSQNSGCTINTDGTDSSLIATTGLNQSFSLSQLTPCITMENIASSLDYFYSDYNQSGSSSTCQDASHTVTTMSQIFSAIAGTFTTPRLLPNDAT
jgi:hypothetical protein